MPSIEYVVLVTAEFVNSVFEVVQIHQARVFETVCQPMVN